MNFDATPGNMTTLLVVALALVAVVFLLRKKYESNLPLLFYFVAVIWINFSDRAINPYLLYTGVGFALLLRFEYLNQGFAKLVAVFATTSMCAIIWAFLVTVFGEGLAPF